MDIKITKGLNIPIKGKPEAQLMQLAPSGQSEEMSRPKEVSLNLWPFDDLRLKLLKKVGEKVQLGEPLCEDKSCPERKFVSPAGGVIKDVRRGLKRRIMDIVIAVDEKEEIFKSLPFNPKGATRYDILERLMSGGLFTRIYQRPFSLLAHPEKLPRSIFVKAVESAPFAPPAELQVKDHEEEFQVGLTALKKMSLGSVHLVFSSSTTCSAFLDAQDVEKHTVQGPHPAGTYSVFIQHIDPITSPEDVVWTLDVHDVVSIGKLLSDGEYFKDRVISIAGPGIIEGQRGYFKVREGFPIATLAAGRIPKDTQRLISGNPLTGNKVDMEDFLGYKDYVFCAITENTERELLHFFRLGLKKFSFSRAYASGHFDHNNTEYVFTTSQHGEHRAFIDPTLYDQVQPLNVPTMQLVKAVMAEDYDLAEELGLLEVDAEDFALPTFVCPSKIEMMEIVKQGIRAHAKELVE